MVDRQPMADKPRRWRPWQFSLRTLLILTLAVACFLGGWTTRDWVLERELERARQQAELDRAKALRQLRASRVIVAPAGPLPVYDADLEIQRPKRRYDLINDLPASGVE